MVAALEHGTPVVKYYAVSGTTEADDADLRGDKTTVAAVRTGVRFTAQVVKKRGAK
jgi:hypothetical protein